MRCVSLLQAHARPFQARLTILAPSRAMAEEHGAFTYRWPRPALTVDIVIVARPKDDVSNAHLLLVCRKHAPCKGLWALPGGFVNEGEPLGAAAARELQEETSVDPSSLPRLVQVGTYGDPGRDPRGWTVTVAYGCVVDSTELGVKAADDAQDAKFWPVNDLPSLAFDHKLIVREALHRLAELPETRGGEGSKFSALLLEGAAMLEGPWERPTE